MGACDRIRPAHAPVPPLFSMAGAPAAPAPAWAGMLVLYGISCTSPQETQLQIGIWICGLQDTHKVAHTEAVNRLLAVPLVTDVASRLVHDPWRDQYCQMKGLWLCIQGT